MSSERLTLEVGYNVTHGVPKAQAYNITMYIMAGLLVIGFVCNMLVKAVNKRFHMQPDLDSASDATAVAPASRSASESNQKGSTTVLQLDSLRR
jgi:hypothetical protein